MPLRLWSLALAATLLAGPAAGQSLGEVAAREKEKRAKQVKPPKAYTNDDLKKVTRPKDDSSPSSSTVADTAGSSDESSEEEKPNESEWRQRADSAREAIPSAEAKVQAIQDRINALRLDRDPTGVTDPFRLQSIQAEIATAQEELTAAKAEVSRAREALTSLEDEARRKGVPPGWLRER